MKFITNFCHVALGEIVQTPGNARFCFFFFLGILMPSTSKVIFRILFLQINFESYL